MPYPGDPMRILRNILGLLCWAPFAVLIALAIAGAFVALFGALAGLDQVKTAAGVISGFCALAFFVLLLSPLGEILAALPGLAPQPAPPPPAAPPASPPASPPPTGRTLWKWIRIVAAVWTGLFLCLWLPVAAIYKHQVMRRPVVIATVIDHRMQERPKHTSKPVGKSVRATVSFKRPHGSVLVDCRLENYAMGLAANPKSWATTLELAVHPHSCSAPVELPLQTDYDDHVFAYFVALFALLVATCLITLANLQSTGSGGSVRLARPAAAGAARDDQPS